MPSDSAVEQFGESLRGDLIRAGDPAYDEARRVYNGMIDKRPSMIARCVDVADVITAVNFARENDVLVAVRGGGHNGPGLGTCDGGLVIDLGQMKGVRVDPRARTVTAGPGCTQGDVDHATHPFGLAVPAGIVSTTGLAGLALGGGHGYLTRQYGLTADNLIEADVVLADGRFVTASGRENTDLFWALRGGGGNFGIVTSFVFRAHPVHTIYGGPIFYDIADARQVMQWYREFLPASPEKLFVFLGLKMVPAAPPFPEAIYNKRICALICCYDGSAEEAEEALRPLGELPDPIFKHVGPMPFTALQSLFDPLLPPGLQWYWKGDFVKELPDAAIDAHLEHAARAPQGLSLMHLYPIDGAVHRIAADETAWSYRDAIWSMVIAGIDPEPANAGAIATWAKEYWDAVHPYCAGGAYVNFMMEEGEERVAATYRGNLQRLREIKTKYDPTNFFRVNQNIPPA